MTDFDVSDLISNIHGGICPDTKLQKKRNCLLQLTSDKGTTGESVSIKQSFPLRASLGGIKKTDDRFRTPALINQLTKRNPTLC